MPTEALRCPTCSAHDNSRADANGIHTCVYCGVRYRLTGGTTTTLAPPRTPLRPRESRAAIVGATLGVAAIAMGIAVYMRNTAPGPTPTPVEVHAREAIARELAAQGLPTTTTTTTPLAPTVGVDATVSVPVTPEAPAAAHFELTHRRPSSGTTFYAVGWVTNDSPFVIDKPKIVAVLEDAAGVEVGTAFGFADDVMAAGAKDAAEVLVMNPPPFATIRFEIAPRKATYIPARAEGLRIEPGAVGPAAFGSGFATAGKVFNDGKTGVRFVHVRALAFDAADTLLAIDDTYADAEVLQPGASARYDLSMLDVGATPARWEFQVTASPEG